MLVVFDFTVAGYIPDTPARFNFKSPDGFVAFNFQGSPTYSEPPPPIVFDFGALGSIDFDITATSSVILGLVVSASASLMPPVTRWIVGRVIADTSNAIKSVAKSRSLLQQALSTQTKRLAPTDSATKVGSIVHSVVEDSIFLNNNALSDQKNSSTLNVDELITYTSLLPRLASFRSDLQFAYSVTTKFSVAMEQMTKIYPEKWCAIVQSFKDNYTINLRRYWTASPTNYLPTVDIDLQHQSIPIDTIVSESHYWSNVLPVFDFIEQGYTVQAPLTFNFNAASRTTGDSHYNVYPLVNMATISVDVATPYNTDTLFARDNDQVGIIRTNYCFIAQATKPKKIKRCVQVDMARKPPRGQSPWIDLPRPEPPTNPPSGNTLTIPIKEVYTMKNTISVTLNDLTAIEMDDLSLAFDVDSFAWQFSGQLLDPAQLSLVKPLANGDAVVLIVTINNVVWHVMAEKISHNRQFGQRSITISGRGLSALLAAPYRVAGSGTQGSLLTNQQLADSHVPFGWTLNWQATTWNVTGGAYSWQNRTELEAIADIAAWCGAMLIPARDSQTLTVKPRYPVLPWNFAATAVDVAIPEAVITDMTYREASQKHPNGVYVHGGEIGGQLAFCRLNSTAGDILVETTSNPLMTDPTGLRALGERLLAGQYIQPDIEQITTFMDGSTVPFIDVGTLVGVTVDSVETKAIVNSVSVNANQGEVYQTLTLGEQSSNQWIAFRSLLPKDPLLVGTITSTTGTSSIIQLIDGGVLNVRGTGAVNSKVYIRSGQIQGEAPNMVQTTIVI